MKPILILDPGHGGRDPGGGSNSSFLEKNMVLDISLYQLQRFKELGVPVTITRTSDDTLDPGPRAKLVRDSGAKYCISNHINAAVNSAARGVETIHSIFSDGKLAHALYRAIVAEGMPGRRVFCREGAGGKDYYFMHRETGAVETIIVEYGFATNDEDTKLLIENWKRYAEAVVRGFCMYTGLPYSVPGYGEKKEKGEDKVIQRINEHQEVIDNILKRVYALEKRNSMTVPDWAKDAVEAAVNKGLVDTPDGGSYDFYRLLTVMHRQGLI